VGIEHETQIPATWSDGTSGCRSRTGADNTDNRWPIEIQASAGPNGLEAWTLNYEIPLNKGSYPEILVIARNGRILRKLQGEPFVWDWIFLRNGKEVAYQAGPLHFGLSCILFDLSKGKQLADYDCYRMPLPADAPSWVKELMNPH
jgi:hypothetical protein